MPETFFEPGKPSKCLFTPKLECDKFFHGMPTATVDFLCDIQPQTVGVVLPPAEGEEGALWNRVYERIAEVLGGRKYGFRCFAIRSEDWTAAKPCDACSLTRGAQGVIIDISAGDPRAEGFKEMAAASAGVVQMFRSNTGIEVPKKKVILIHHRPVQMAPHLAAALDVIDYAGADGEPDLDLLAARIEEIAGDLYDEVDIGVLDAADVLGEDDAQERPPEPGVGASPEPDPTPAVPAPESAPSPPAAAPGNGGSDLSDEELVRILGPVEEVAVPEEEAPAEKAAEAADPLAAAALALDAGEPEAALTGLLSAVADDPRYGELLERCLEAADCRQLVSAFFATSSGGRLTLDHWREGPVSGARLVIGDGELKRQLGESVPLYACQPLTPENVGALRDELLAATEEQANGAGAAAVVVSPEFDEPVGRQLAELRTARPRVRAIDIRRSEVEEAVRRRSSAADLLRQRLDRGYQRATDPYLTGIHRVAWDSETFCGRRELLATLDELLDAGRPFALYGLPRMGKSSLLRRLTGAVRERSALLVNVDLRRQPPQSLADLYSLIAVSLCEAAARCRVSAAASERLLDVARQPSTALAERFDTALTEFAAAVRDEAAVERLILVLDEVELLIAGCPAESAAVDSYKELFELLHRLDRRGWGVGMTGFGALLERELRDPGWPLGELRLLPVAGLSEAALEDLVRRLGHRARRYFTADAVSEIARAAGGAPWLTRYLCSTVLEARGPGEEPIDAEAVQHGVGVFIGSPNLRHKLMGGYRLVEAHFPDGARLLRAIAGGQDPSGWVDCAWLEKEVPLGRDLPALLERLSAYGLLERVDGGDAYRIRASLLHHQLRPEAGR